MRRNGSAHVTTRAPRCRRSSRSRWRRESRSVAEGGLTPEQLAEQIKALKVSDLLLSTISALLPGLEGQLDEQLLRDFNQLLANVRLSYADALTKEDQAGNS